MSALISRGERLELRLGRGARCQHRSPADRHRIARERGLVLGLRDVRRGIAKVMTHEAKGIRFEQRRPVAAARALDGLTHRVPHRRRIVAVDGDARHAVGGRAIGDVRHRRCVFVVRAFAVAVILAEEYHRQLPQRGHVQRLMEGPDVGRAIAEGADRHAPVIAQLRGQRESVCDRQPAADDARGHHDAGRRIGDVHRAAFAFAGARRLAVVLCAQLPQGHALGELVVNAAIHRDEVVARLEVHAHGGRDDLLPARRIIDGGHASGAQQRAHALIDEIDQQRLAIDREQRRRRKCFFGARVHRCDVMPGEASCLAVSLLSNNAVYYRHTTAGSKARNRSFCAPLERLPEHRQNSLDNADHGDAPLAVRAINSLIKLVTSSASMS